MKTRSLLLSAAAFCALTASADASTVNGWYIGLEGGGSWIDDADFTGSFDPDPPGGAVTPFAGTFQFDTGWAVLATVGYGFAGHWRAELEAGYRNNDVDTPTESQVDEWSAMFNLIYDIPVTQSLTLSLGAGAGADFADVDFGTGNFQDDDWNFAYQGIAGLSYALSSRLDVTLTYRYLRVLEPEFTDPTLGPPGTTTFSLDDVSKHTATIGLRYAFGAPPAPEPVVAPPPPPPPEPTPQVPQQFIVFFGFNKCNITAEADNVLSEAASAAKQLGTAMIQIVGHTDTSGSNKYNQKLSDCRANAAKTNLVGKGIAAGAISATGRGETELMVQTADGVREPQNRRANINLQ